MVTGFQFSERPDCQDNHDDSSNVVYPWLASAQEWQDSYDWKGISRADIGDEAKDNEKDDGYFKCFHFGHSSNM